MGFSGKPLFTCYCDFCICVTGSVMLLRLFFQKELCVEFEMFYLRGWGGAPGHVVNMNFLLPPVFLHFLLDKNRRLHFKQGYDEPFRMRA